MRKDTQKSFRDACFWVSWTLLTSIINIFSFNLYLVIFFSLLLSFALHFRSGAQRPGYLGIVALASCTYNGLFSGAQTQTHNGSEVHVVCVRWSTVKSQEPLNPSFLPRDKLRGDLVVDQLGRNATSWTSISVSLLILECWSCLQVVFWRMTRVSSSAHGDLH